MNLFSFIIIKPYVLFNVNCNNCSVILTKIMTRGRLNKVVWFPNLGNVKALFSDSGNLIRLKMYSIKYFFKFSCVGTYLPCTQISNQFFVYLIQDFTLSVEVHLKRVASSCPLLFSFWFLNTSLERQCNLDSSEGRWSPLKV